MIQIRHVPDDLHRKLKIRAVRAGMSLSDYLLGEIAQIANRPTVEEVLERISRRPAVRVKEESPAAVRAAREGRK